MHKYMDNFSHISKIFTVQFGRTSKHIRNILMDNFLFR